MYIHTSNETSLNRPTMGLNFKWSLYGGGHIRELEYSNIFEVSIIGAPTKVIDIEECSGCDYIYISQSLSELTDDASDFKW